MEITDKTPEELMKSKQTVEKDQLFSSSKISVQKSEIHGYGVFATDDIKTNELIEECVFTRLSHRSKEMVMDPILRQYLYTIPCNCDTCKHAGGHLAIGSGNITIYNHGEQGVRNVGFNWIPENKIIQVIAMKDIKKGEELLNTYGDIYSPDMFEPPST